jgi:hypothetical protein
MLWQLAGQLEAKTSKPWKTQLWHVGGQAFEDVTGLPIIKEDVILQDGRIMSREDYNSHMAIAEHTHDPSRRLNAVASLHVQEVHRRATFAKSQFVPGAIWQEHYTVGVLDELPTAPTLIQNQIREMIDGQLNGDPIDPKCLYVATGNPPDPRFVTVNALDEALEKRLKVYVVIPTKSELLQVWERIMPETIYKFLLMEQTFIDTLSPREWVGVAKDVQDTRDGGGSLPDAIEEACDELADHQNVAVALRKFVKFGDDPYYYPILGKDLLAADAKTRRAHMSLIGRWIKDDKRGFVGESNGDLLRTLANITQEEFEGWNEKKRTTAAENIVEFIEILAANKCNDMAKQTLACVFKNTGIVTPVANMLKKSPVLQQMTDIMHLIEARRQELDATGKVSARR